MAEGPPGPGGGRSGPPPPGRALAHHQRSPFGGRRRYGLHHPELMWWVTDDSTRTTPRRWVPLKPVPLNVGLARKCRAPSPRPASPRACSRSGEVAVAPSPRFRRNEAVHRGYAESGPRWSGEGVLGPQIRHCPKPGSPRSLGLTTGTTVVKLGKRGKVLTAKRRSLQNVKSTAREACLVPNPSPSLGVPSGRFPD
ncbi:MAG: hypothetical protein CM15mP18_5200 [Methanobacteriota archaeon]|nr:MAG: hypothetical protein CM15mP18_5200 [Euryarchaeota archaeon]